jgi:hypothetical protein
MTQRTKDQHHKLGTTHTGFLPEMNEYDLEDAGTAFSEAPKGSISFPGAQYFNEIFLEKKAHKITPKSMTKWERQ